MVDPGTAPAGMARSSFGSRDGAGVPMPPRCPPPGQSHPQAERLFRNCFRAAPPSPARALKINRLSAGRSDPRSAREPHAVAASPSARRAGISFTSMAEGRGPWTAGLLVDEAWAAYGEDRYREAVAAASRTVQAARELDDPVLLVRALWIEASALRLMGDSAFHAGGHPPQCRATWGGRPALPGHPRRPRRHLLGAERRAPRAGVVCAGCR